MTNAYAGLLLMSIAIISAGAINGFNLQENQKVCDGDLHLYRGVVELVLRLKVTACVLAFTFYLGALMYAPAFMALPWVQAAEMQDFIYISYAVGTISAGMIGIMWFSFAGALVFDMFCSLTPKN